MADDKGAGMGRDAHADGDAQVSRDGDGSPRDRTGMGPRDDPDARAEDARAADAGTADTRTADARAADTRADRENPRSGV
jgi:hypothetical protein